MIYTDLERIYKTRGIENKYALAMIVSTRARQLSERKGRNLAGDSSEQYITYALEEVKTGELVFARRQGVQGEGEVDVLIVPQDPVTPEPEQTAESDEEEMDEGAVDLEGETLRDETDMGE